MIDVELTGNGLWCSKGMIRNYEYARSINDTQFIQLFEGAYPDAPKELFDKLASGDYYSVPNEDTVIVTLESEETEEEKP